MNVLSLVPYTVFPSRTGGQKGIALFNRYFARHCRLVCATVPGNEPAFAEGYTIYNVLPAGSFRYIDLRLFFTLRKLIRREGITHLVLEHPYFGWLGVWLKKTTRVRLVVHSHNIEAARWKSLGKWWWKALHYYEGWTHRRADYNFFISEEDHRYALNAYGLLPQRCIVVPYGIEWDRAPGNAHRQTCRQQLLARHGIDPSAAILLFNGAFNYKPNSDALLQLLRVVNPLLQQTGLKYTILICGKDIPDDIIRQQWPQVVFAGFVDDVASYFTGADVFLNPITEGGGIKTKLVEALGYDLAAVSTRSGAFGIPPALCEGKLLVCEDTEWTTFASLIPQAVNVRASVPAAYFEHFYWDNVALKAARFIQEAPLGPQGRTL